MPDTLPAKQPDSLKKLSTLENFYHPDLFNWFLGTLLIFSGIAYFLFPQVISEQGFSTSLQFTGLIKLTLILLGISLLVFGSNKVNKGLPEKIIYLLIVISTASLAFIFFQTQNPLTALENGVLALLLLIYLVISVRDLAKMTFLIDAWVFFPAILFSFWPNTLGFPPLIYWAQNNQTSFIMLLAFVLIILFVLSWQSLQENKSVLSLFSLFMAIFFLVTSLLTSGAEPKDIMVYSAVLSIFIFSLPIWPNIEPLGRLTLLKLLNAFTWLVLAILIGGILSLYFRNSFNAFLTSELTKKTSDASQTVETYFAVSRQTLAHFQNNTELLSLMMTKSNPIAIEAELKELFLTSMRFIKLFIVNQEGQIIASYPRDLAIQGLDVSSQSYFQSAKANHWVTIPEITWSKTTPLLPSVIISGQLVGSNSAFLGAVLGSTDFVNLQDLLDKFKYNDQTVITLADQQQEIIITPDTGLLKAHVESSNPLAKALSGQTGIEEGYNSQKELAIRAYTPIKSLGWGISIEQPLQGVGADDATVSAIYLIAVISGISALFIILYLDRRKRVDVPNV